MHASHERRCAGLAAAVAAGALGGAGAGEQHEEQHQSAVLMDLDVLDATIQHVLQAGYPDGALHTVAVKANPVGGVLRRFREMGMGAEAASLGELKQALCVGFTPDAIVFDSPAKTVGELRFALASGVAVNLDNFQELERVAALLQAEPALLGDPQRQLIGLRINPQVGEGSIAALSTGGAVSKFGLPLREVRQQLVDAFCRHSWLNMLHLHVGSQGMPLELVAAGAEAVWGLLEEVERACGAGRVRALDVGGGLSVDFGSDEPPQESQFCAQASLLAARVPALFSPGCPVRLITENGRSLLAKAGCAASRVEYTKSCGGRHIAICHLGADLFMRACYLPDTWGLRVFVCDAQGSPRDGREGEELVAQDVAGPLCFQGDRLAVGRTMPKARVGDLVVVADAGAYTLSMYSRYNSRCSPPVYGYRIPPGGGPAQLQLLRAGETLDQVLEFGTSYEFSGWAHKRLLSAAGGGGSGKAGSFAAGAAGGGGSWPRRRRAWRAAARAPGG